ncbi:MAG TPA: DUF1015 domain-containing protein [Acidimicrobiales bacterium]|nr:DUF1015 domain-containing protein [Acidimicrobiales bacterium]
MPRFEPFPAVRYDTGRVPLDAVVAPPYDVIGAEDRERLAARSPHNVVHVDLPRAEAGGDPYAAAGARFAAWLRDGILAVDDEPGFYVYRMGWRDELGRAGQTTGVVGAVELAPPGAQGVLPHERTMGKPKDDRLNLMRATRANLSPIWGLSLAPGLSALCEEVSGPPVARHTDDEGVHHRLWPLRQPALVAAVTETVAQAPVVIADGHHRYETALAYREERRAATAGAPGDHDLVLAYLVELTGDQISIGPIHRLVSGLPPDFDPVVSLTGDFEVVDDRGPPGLGLLDRMVAEEALGLVTPAGTWLLRPRPELGGGRNGSEPDAGLLERSLAAWPPHETTYPHRAGDVVAAVAAGSASVGLLLRPATVEQIAAAARAGRRMPQKTTFFRPKLRTGLVFRQLVH